MSFRQRKGSKNLIMLAMMMLALLSSVVHSRASLEDAEKWPNMDYAFREWGNDMYWKTYTVTTIDGFILTMFRIMGNADGSEPENAGSKGPMLIHHGFSTSGITWFQREDETMPAMPVQLYNEGYDVWISSIRGTQYSRLHKRYDADFDPKYWDFDMSDVAEKDLHAFLKRILLTNTSCQKVSIVASSAGAMQTYNFLSKATRARKYISQVVTYEPCIVANVENVFAGLDDDYYRILNTGLQVTGILSFWGPQWESQKNMLCNWFGQEGDVCIALENQVVANETYWFGRRETAIKLANQMAQNYLFDEFQESALIWSWPFKKQKKIKLENIHPKIPFRAVWLNDDVLCPRAITIRWINQIRGYTPEDDVYLDGEHGSMAPKNTAEFFEQLQPLLRDHGKQMSYSNCKKKINFGMKNTSRRLDDVYDDFDDYDEDDEEEEQCYDYNDLVRDYDIEGDDDWQDYYYGQDPPTWDDGDEDFLD